MVHAPATTAHPPDPTSPAGERRPGIKVGATASVATTTTSWQVYVASAECAPSTSIHGSESMNGHPAVATPTTYDSDHAHIQATVWIACSVLFAATDAQKPDGS